MCDLFSDDAVWCDNAVHQSPVGTCDSRSHQSQRSQSIVGNVVQLHVNVKELKKVDFL